MKNIPVLLALILVTSPLRPAGGASSAPQRPNVVFVLTDDQRWDSLSCAGHPFLKTPHIDRLAAEGAMFQNFFVTTPLCSPSRASFLTGQYVHKNRVYGNGDSELLSHRLITWPRLLHDKAGYETAYMGKIHMGSDATPRPGFDRWICMHGQGVYNDPPLNIDGKEQKLTGYLTDLLNDFAVDFIRKDHGGKPFALCLAHKAVHQPAVPAERHKDLYTDDRIPRPPSVQDDLKGKPFLQNRAQQPAGNAPRGPGERLIRNQLRCIQSVDDGVGKILKALEETGQLDNTLIIFTSDNGYFWGEHTLGDKRAAYDESIRDPLLMRYPKLIKAGTRPEQIALNIDIAPTMLELAQVPIPADVHGKSLVPLMTGIVEKWRTAALFEYFNEPKFPLVPTWQAVRTEQWKYIHYTDVPNYDELYDLRADPYEMKNRIADPSAAEQLKALRAEMQRQLDATK